MELRDKSVLVLGAGEVGLEAARFLQQKGTKVFLLGQPLEAEIFSKDAKDFSPKTIVRFAENMPEDFPRPELVLCAESKAKRPALLNKLRKEGIPIRTGLELACELAVAKVAAITGSNGKSTTAKMIELMLNKSHLPVTLAGGSFSSYFEAIPKARDSKTFLLEVSSYQLGESETFQPSLAVMTNLSKAHRDRHGGSTEYARAKGKIFARQGPEDILIYNADNDPLVNLVQEAPSLLFPVYIPKVSNPFAEKKPEGPQVFYADKKFHLVLPDGAKEEYSTEKIKLRAQHHFENAMGALACARLLGATSAAVQEALEEFAGLPHRMQKIISARGVDWYDDSRASNPTATSWGIWGFKQKVILITGGRETYTDYRPMSETVKARVKLLVLLGQSRRSMDAALKDLTEMYLVKTLEEAVKLAYARAEKGDVVIYSPACPPEPGLFSSMEHRGEIFAKLVQKEIDSDVRDKMSRIHRLPGEAV